MGTLDNLALAFGIKPLTIDDTVPQLAAYITDPQRQYESCAVWIGLTDMPITSYDEWLVVSAFKLRGAKQGSTNPAVLLARYAKDYYAVKTSHDVEALREFKYRVFPPQFKPDRRRKHAAELADRLDAWCSESRKKVDNLIKSIPATAARKAREQQQTPAWSETAAIKAFKKNCPKGFQVDHTVPLAARMSTNHPQLASGLHVLANLQYKPRADNAKKHSYFDPWFDCSFPKEVWDDPDEGLKDSYKWVLKKRNAIVNPLLAFKEAVWLEQGLTTPHLDALTGQLTTLIAECHLLNPVKKQAWQLIVEAIAAELDTLPINFEETPYHV